MYTNTLMQDSLNMPKCIPLANIKQHVKFEIATYAKKLTNHLFEQFHARIYWTTCFIYVHWQVLSRGGSFPFVSH